MKKGSLERMDSFTANTESTNSPSGFSLLSDICENEKDREKIVDKNSDDKGHKTQAGFWLPQKGLPKTEVHTLYAIKKGHDFTSS